MDPSPELRIARLRTQFVVPAVPGAAAPDGIRARLDPVLAGPFAGACAETVGALAPSSDPSVWVLRHVRLDFALQVDGVTDVELARRWSGELARRVARAMREGPDGRDVLRFADRTSHVVHVVEALTAGEDWDEAVFAPFEGLRPLPRDAAIATLLAGDAASAGALLAKLHERSSLDAVLAVLGDHGARRVLASWPREDEPRSIDDLHRWMPLLRRLSPEPPAPTDAAAALRVLAASLAHAGSTPPGRLRALIEDLQALRRWFANGFIVAVQSRLPVHVHTLDGLPSAWAIAAEAASIEALAQAVQATPDLPVGRNQRSAAGASPHAGALLLLDALIGSGVDEDLALLDPASLARPALRALVLAHAIGCAAAADDPLLHVACGADPEADAAAALRLALASLRVRRLLRSPQVLARGGTVSRIRLESFARPRTAAREALVWTDGAADWCRISPRSARGPDAPPADTVLTQDLRLLAIDAGAPDDWARALTFAWLARRTLRRFARGLPGFSRSSIAHLRENFLAGGGTLRREPGGWRLLLQAPPLALVLRIAGRHHDVLSLPWLDGVPLHVELEDAS